MSRPRRSGRDVHGVIVLDKPQGMCSNNVLQKIKRMYNANRAGYAGTLDSLATGILPICLGEATKFSQYLLNSDKRYYVTAKLGQRTDTHDRYGQIIEEYNISFSKEQLYTVLESFRGNTLQVPPMYSALKYQGKKFYEYAKQGIEIQRKARPITVYELIFIRHEGTELELEIHCSKGTYIRTIIDDLGKKLNCGAHVTSLRRIAVSKYTVEHTVPFNKLILLKKQEKKQGITPFKLLDKFLMPIYSPVIDFPIVNLSLKHSMYFKKGNSIHVSDMILSGLVRVTEGKDNKFIGIGELNSKGIMVPRRLIV